MTIEATAAAVEAWCKKHIHESPVSRDVHALNHLRAALPDLVARLEKAEPDKRSAVVEAWVNRIAAGSPVARDETVLAHFTSAAAELTKALAGE